MVMWHFVSASPSDYSQLDEVYVRSVGSCRPLCMVRSSIYCRGQIWHLAFRLRYASQHRCE